MRVWIASLLFLGLSHSASAETFVLKKTTGPTVPVDQRAALDELLQSAVEGYPGSAITDRAESADGVLEPRMIKIGGAYVLILGKYRRGKLVFTTQGRAKSIEDMDTVAARVVRSALTEVPFEKDAAIKDVTEDEVTRGKLRIGSVQQIFFGIGPVGGWNYGSGSIGANAIVGKTWSMDARYSLDLAGEMLWLPGGAYAGDVHGALEYFFDENNHSPFLIANFGYGFATVNQIATDGVSGLLGLRESTGGFLVGGGAGYKLFRAHSTGLGFSLRYLFNTGTTALGHPSQLVGAVMMYF